jgi:PKD repeat protein
VQTPGYTTTYSWDFGDNTQSSLENPTHTYLTSGIFNVILTATTSGTNCDGVIQGQVIINPVPQINGTIIFN